MHLLSLAVLRSSSSYVIQVAKPDLGVSLHTCLSGDCLVNLQGVEHHLGKDFLETVGEEPPLLQIL